MDQEADEIKIRIQPTPPKAGNIKTNQVEAEAIQPSNHDVE